MLPRAHAKKFSGARQHDNKKICKKNLLLQPKATTPFFPHLLFFVVIGFSNKKMLQKCCLTQKENFLFKKISQKVFLMSVVTLVTRGGNLDMTYVFASYTKCFCTIKIGCSSQVQEK